MLNFSEIVAILISYGIAFSLAKVKEMIAAMAKDTTILISAGGDGTRNYPASNKSLSKPFGPFVDGLSYIQYVYKMFDEIGFDTKSYWCLVANQTQRDNAYEQLVKGTKIPFEQLILKEACPSYPEGMKTLLLKQKKQYVILIPADCIILNKEAFIAALIVSRIEAEKGNMAIVSAEMNTLEQIQAYGNIEMRDGLLNEHGCLELGDKPMAEKPKGKAAEHNLNCNNARAAMIHQRDDSEGIDEELDSKIRKAPYYVANTGVYMCRASVLADKLRKADATVMDTPDFLRLANQIIVPTHKLMWVDAGNSRDYQKVLRLINAGGENFFDCLKPFEHDLVTRGNNNVHIGESLRRNNHDCAILNYCGYQYILIAKNFTRRSIELALDGTTPILAVKDLALAERAKEAYNCTDKICEIDSHVEVIENKECNYKVVAIGSNFRLEVYVAENTMAFELESLD